ncbi:AraC family transcriptional regulator [Alkalicaulis satelles]|uniref:AraC family transcriptional regulator n=2 Tax=Alkalicaulis satelles TaxID=2609175 RepID=A0A5M6ZJJ4_9PROT|nr:AraC family transcriptional regulator [Alkalicaulis satelles]
MALPMRVEAGAGPFSARLRLRPFGPITLIDVSGSAQRLIRDQAQIDAGARGVCFISTMTRHSGWLEANGARRGGETGKVTYVSGDTPFTLEFEADFAFISAMIPAEDIEALTPRYALAHGGEIAPPAGPAVAALLTAIKAQDGSAALENRLYTHFLGMAAASIDAALEPLAASRAERDRLLLGRIKADLASRLADPVRADGAALAARFNITRRKLQRLFQSEDTTLTAWVTEQRLIRCARDLRDPRYGSRSVTDIASSWGFADMGHVSRAFRKRFGVSPTVWRRQAAQETSPAA